MKTIFFTVFFLFALITNSFGQIAESAEDISPLMISEKIPSVLITSVNGEKVSLIDIVKKKRTILLFYRGGWCPYCNAHLSAVGQLEEEIRNLNYQIIGISPDSPEKLSASIDKNELNYLLYSDSDGALMKAMGIAFKAPDRHSKRLLKYSNDENSGFLPVPSLFVVDTDGTIIFEYISPDYKNRISLDLLINVLEGLNTK